ncbi:MAG TPA: hypothetical protein VHT73_06035 [Thermodesulfobacteriota bacterium]|nr:hypothetical protein [Thermodesulfobacteriota bacterium]
MRLSKGGSKGPKRAHRKELEKESSHMKALKIIFRSSDLPEEEKEKILFEVLHILLYEDNKIFEEEQKKGGKRENNI